MAYTKQQKLAIFKNLPEEIKEAMGSATTSAAIMEISKKHNFHVDTIADFTDEIGLVMLGLTKTQDFESSLGARLKTGVAETKGIADEVHDKILRPIQFILRNLGRRQDLTTDETLETPPPPAGFTGPYSGGSSATIKPTVLSSNVLTPQTKPAAQTPPTSPTMVATPATAAPETKPPMPTTSLIDQKMAGPTALAKVNIEKTMPPSIPIPRPSTAPKTYTVDPYREAAK